jgi:hypothetical protein
LDEFPEKEGENSPGEKEDYSSLRRGRLSGQVNGISMDKGMDSPGQIKKIPGARGEVLCGQYLEG